MDLVEKIEKILTIEKYGIEKLSYQKEPYGLRGKFKCDVCGKEMSRKEFTKNKKCEMCK